jgi:hypothetical protein
MIQALPGKTITTVAFGTSTDGFPLVLICASDGTIVRLDAHGHHVEPTFRVSVITPADDGGRA